MKKTLWQIVKFTLISCIVSVLQIVLVNVFTLISAPDKEWPYLLSNLLANVYGYYRNRKTTFKAASKPWSLPVYIIVLLVLIGLMTPFQVWVAGLAGNAGSTFLKDMAPTIASMSAGMIQFLVLFPLEKYVLFIENPENKKTGKMSGESS